jgi:hypothetical protein
MAHLKVLDGLKDTQISKLKVDGQTQEGYLATLKSDNLTFEERLKRATDSNTEVFR